jgi:dTDP-glucose pyrophosphorylase
MDDLEKMLVTVDVSIWETIEAINRGSVGIALVVDDERKLLGTLTDGDIRRALLAEIDLSDTVTELLKNKADLNSPSPITAPSEMNQGDVRRLMKQNDIRHMPMLDEDGCVVDLVVMDYPEPGEKLPVTAVIMAGGYGMRLRPLTEETPKPMLHIEGRPILEWIIEGLKKAGIRSITIATYYRAEKIKQHFGDGRRLGVEIEYILENEATGTAGCLGQLKQCDQPLLVINGDILTRLDFRSMFEYHMEHRADITVAVREYKIGVPYGVVEMDGVEIKALKEKPSLGFYVNAGIYVLEPPVVKSVTAGKFQNMTTLIDRLIREDRPVVGFPVREYWIDIGQDSEYKQAQEDVSKRRL